MAVRVVPLGSGSSGNATLVEFGAGSLADHGRRNQETPLVKTDREVAVVGRDPPFFINATPDFDELQSELLFGDSHPESRF